MSLIPLRHLIYPVPHIGQQRLREKFGGRWVVITGASSGVGLALSRQLIGVGAKVYLIARTEAVLSALCDEARQLGTEAICRAVDLRDRPSLEALCRELPRLLPHVDFLFCNAGKSIRRTIVDAADRLHDYDRTMDLNYRSMVALTLALLPSLTDGSRMVYTSSVSTLYPAAPGWSAYHASKSAANVWCETADAELARRGIRVMVAYLPLVHTPMSDATPRYRRLPAYTATEAALVLLRLSMGSCCSYCPWWARLTAPVARACAPLIRFVYRRL